MNYDDLNITGISLGKKVEVEYEVLKEARTYIAKDDEMPHPDFRKALDAFKEDIAESFDLDDHEDNFVIRGVTVSGTQEKGFGVTIKGKMTTIHSEQVSVNSGKIPIPDDKEGLIDKVRKIRTEAFKYIFEKKTAQGELDFDDKTDKA